MSQSKSLTSLALICITTFLAGCSGAEGAASTQGSLSSGSEDEGGAPAQDLAEKKGSKAKSGSEEKTSAEKTAEKKTAEKKNADKPQGDQTLSAPPDIEEEAEGDGVATDRDLCPGTEPGAPVDKNGCSQAQREESYALAETPAVFLSEEELSARALKAAALIEDGKIQGNGFKSFVLDPSGKFPVILKTLAENVKELENGFALAGTILVEIPGGEHLSLLEAEVKLERDASRGPGLQSFEGTVRVPFPDVGFLENVEVADPAMATVGYELGADIEGVDAPLKDDRKYFYFNFSAGLSASIGDVSLSASGGQAMTLALDPSDPSFFARASMSGLMGPIQDASFGFSLGGHLPFTPENTWGIDANAAAFDGHVWLGGKVSLQSLKLPLAIGGNTVVDVDPDGDGSTIFQDPSQGYQFGSNSELDLSLEAGLIGIEVPIAKATVVGHLGQDAQYAYYSGKIRQGNDWLRGVVPIEQSVELKTAGFVSSDVLASYLEGQGDFSLDASTLGSWTGLSLNDLAVVQAKLRVDREGVLLQGTASADFSPVLGLHGDALAEAFFNGNPEDWYVMLDGELTVKGVSLSAAAHAELDKNGMFVNGSFLTPISAVAMSGSVTRAGVDVRGKARVEIPIVAGREIVQEVTNAVICGTETVTDATLCGTRMVEDGARCGYETVTSATLCGKEYVEDAAKCGTTYAANAAKCGTRVIKDGATCGWDTVGSCLGSIFTKGSTDGCKEAKSCNVAISCHVPNRCEVDAKCDVPSTCPVPETCERVKTCETHVTIPDYNYGTVRGTVEVRIGQSGLEGSVSGEYCAVDGGCVTVFGGRLDLSSGSPRACIQVPNVPGEFCAGF